MVKRSTPLDTNETVCPACGAGIKASPSARRRRVQCPKCREVICIESTLGPEPEPLPAPAPVVDTTAAETRSRIELLEARVESLEATLRDVMAAGRIAAANTPQRKFMWIGVTPGRGPDFSSEQGNALVHNLGTVRSQAITIRTPTGDIAARAHADWFKAIFERAGWTVLGPDEVPPNTAGAGLSLAVPELPVAKEAADTYLALKAAGFEAIPVLDRTPRSDSTEKTAMALMLPPVAAT